ncbi:hypothetical protein GGX14DRAFT_402503 [Mycena pura]|uniref:Uncharacterized protein n=1 Tax=Mycena pura TaxID=153505 RepID=A0AAD6UXN8_9AGAR|nr:hypothetical protein GGX14DRAFT_402503 [Mycena pura]
MAEQEAEVEEVREEWAIATRRRIERHEEELRGILAREAEMHSSRGIRVPTPAICASLTVDLPPAPPMRLKGFKKRKAAAQLEPEDLGEGGRRSVRNRKSVASPAPAKKSNKLHSHAHTVTSMGLSNRSNVRVQPNWELTG